MHSQGVVNGSTWRLVQVIRHCVISLTNPKHDNIHIQFQTKAFLVLQKCTNRKRSAHVKVLHLCSHCWSNRTSGWISQNYIGFRKRVTFKKQNLLYWWWCLLWYYNHRLPYLKHIFFLLGQMLDNLMLWEKENHFPKPSL